MYNSIVPIEALRALAAIPAVPLELSTDQRDAVFRSLTFPGGQAFDLERWLSIHQVPVIGEKPWRDGGRIWILERCPFNHEHTGNNKAVVGRHANGAIFAMCQHASCKDKGWHDLRDKFEPGWRDGQSIEAVDDPDRLARIYIDSSCQHVDGETLRSYHDKWYRWNGNVYKAVPESELNAALSRVIKPEFDRVSKETRTTARKVTPSLINNVQMALRNKLLITVDKATPFWVNQDGPWPASEVLAAANGLFHLPSLADGVDSRMSPTPRFFSEFALDYDIVPNAPQPVEWLRFLRQLWPRDPRCIATLQEFMGYCLTPDTRYQKILMIIGPKRSGKGTIARVLAGLIGGKNVAGPTLSSLKTNFGLQPLLGRSLAIFSDARLKTHDDTVVERLLTISGEDLITIDRKHSEPVNVKLNTRLVFISNELPRFSDASGALANRMLPLPLTESFFGREDPTLSDRLLQERSGILTWALEGWKRLTKRRRFKMPRSGRKLMLEMEDLSSPVGQFVRECCQVGPFRQVPKEKLYEAYLEWCERKGHKHPLAHNTFGQHLRAVVTGLDVSHPRTQGRRVWCYQGIDLDV